MRRAPGVVAGLAHLDVQSANDLADAISAWEPAGPEARVQLRRDPIRGNLLGTIELGDHKVELVGLSQPAPAALIARPLAAAHWDDDEKRQAAAHQAHALVQYTAGSDDAVERYLTLFKVCAALGDSLVAVFNEAAWTFAPAGLVRELLQPRHLAAVRRQIPPNVWTGFIAFDVPGGTWFATKGHDLFDVPDLAYFAKTGRAPEHQAIVEMFMNVLIYAHRREPRLAAGHSLEMPHHALMRLDDPPDDVPLLRGYGETLVIAEVDP